MIRDCEVYLSKIKQYDPDPYYVDYFFRKYINSVINTYNEILEKANKDFGLFISQNISKENFYEKAKKKNDQNALKFVEWYSKKYLEEHEKPYPEMIGKLIKNYMNTKLLKIKIMIRAVNRHKEDIHLEINPGLNKGKLRSKEELKIQTKRQIPIFLQRINYKRIQNYEPIVKGDQTTVSAFVEIDDYRDIEIAYVAEIYIQVMRRLVNESERKIKELTTWNYN